jgi:16S rRNA (guanine1516-N2)-methyltransferase
LAGRLELPCVESAGDFEALLVVRTARLELVFPGLRATKPLTVDFVGGAFGYARRLNRFGSLYQAVGLRGGRRPRVLDATAGLGRDAFRLAYAGCDVLAVERSPVLFALLEDGVARALREPEIAARIGGRLRVLCADSRDVLRRTSADVAPDVVYVDPMYPEREKAALVKVEMRLLRRVAGDDPDAAELLRAALDAARERVVVKRMRRAPPIWGAPSHCCQDRTTRYDVYTRPAGRQACASETSGG